VNGIQNLVHVVITDANTPVSWPQLSLRIGIATVNLQTHSTVLCGLERLTTSRRKPDSIIRPMSNCILSRSWALESIHSELAHRCVTVGPSRVDDRLVGITRPITVPCCLPTISPPIGRIWAGYGRTVIANDSNIPKLPSIFRQANLYSRHSSSLKNSVSQYILD
jgi:hypothetical protein